mgnify:CR=1 FL=1
MSIAGFLSVKNPYVKYLFGAVGAMCGMCVPLATSKGGTIVFALALASAAVRLQAADPLIERLAPLDAETRTRLTRIRAPQESGLAQVPAVPARLPSALAIVLWLAGWGVAARQAWRRRPMWRVALLTTVVGGVALMGVRTLERRFEGDHLVMIVGAAPLRVLPALGADAGSTPIVGEVAVVTQRSGAWVAVRDRKSVV